MNEPKPIPPTSARMEFPLHEIAPGFTLKDDGQSPEPRRRKGIYTGAPACFALELAMQQLNAAFGVHASYEVGSVLEREDWRDVDVRMILDDEAFAALFPDAGDRWENDPRWLIMTVALSGWLRQQTGLPVDFQFQPRTHANDRHKGPRSACGLRFAKRNDNEQSGEKP